MGRGGAPGARRDAHSIRWPAGIALVALALAAYLPGINTVPPLEADEARYLEASRAMLAARSWREVVVPHLGGAPRINKPPAAYWIFAGSTYLLTGGDPSRYAFPAALRAAALGKPTLTGSPPTRSQVFTGGVWTYRLPSVAATIAALLIVWRLGVQMFAPPCGWVAAALLGGCFLVTVDARLARTDQLLLLCTCAAQWALWHVWRGGARTGRWAALLWVAVALGILVKGPVTPGVAILTIAALCGATGNVRWLQRLRFGWGAAILAMVLLPPMSLTIAAVGPGPFATAIGDELFGRGVTAVGGRAGPPGYHLALLPGLFWPGWLVVVPGTLLAVQRGFRVIGQRRKNGAGPPPVESAGAPTAGPGFRDSGVRADRVLPSPTNQPADAPATDARRGQSAARGALPSLRSSRWWMAGRPAELFCLAWLVPSWLVLELIGTKLPHYPLPLYPALALLCARAAFAGLVDKLPLARSRLAVVGDAAWLLVGLGLTVLLPLLLATLGGLRREPGVVLALVAYLVVVPTLLIVAWTAIRRRRFVGGLLVATLGTAFCGRGLFETLLPNLDAPWLASAAVRRVAEIDPSGARPLAEAGFARESLAFLTAGRIERVAVSRTREWLNTHPTGLLILGGEPDVLDHPTHVLATLAGFDYVEGRTVTLHILEAAHPGP
ncbi:MAG: ArnT family glycosyltransferase [Phycisphaerae bacterium]